MIAGNDGENVPDGDDQDGQGDSDFPGAEVIEMGTQNEFTETEEEPEEGYIVGEKDAAEFLGISVAAFNQRRKRANRGEAPAIRGEKRVGRSPSWTALDLAEWNNQFRSAS